jgi:hypothetical protein
MANTRARSRNNVRAGLFTSICLILFVCWIIWLGNLLSLFESTQKYVVFFDMLEGAPGLEPGSAVKIGGQEVGRVKKIEFVYTRPADDDAQLTSDPGSVAASTDEDPSSVEGDKADERRDGIEQKERRRCRAVSSDAVERVVKVTISMPNDVTLYDNAVAELEVPLLGAGTAINFSYLGSDDVSAPVGDAMLQPALGEWLRAGLAPPSFLAQAGYGPEQRRQVEEIIKSVHEFAVVLKDVQYIVEATRSEVPKRLEDVAEIAEDIKYMVRRTRDRADGWLDRADVMIDRVDGMTVDAQDGVGSLRELIGDVRAQSDTAWAKAQRSLENIESITEKVDTRTIELVNSAIEDAHAGLGTANRVLDRVNALTTEADPQLRTMMANSRLMAEQIKQLSIEVRRAPWRLLYRPDQKELDSELIYDAARSYAAAASDLRAAAEAMEAIEQVRADGTAVDEAQSARLWDELDQKLERLQVVEDLFLRELRQGQDNDASP